MSNDIRSSLRHSLPGKSRAADHENSRQNAIAMKCLDCCAGQREEVRHCPVVECFLWVHRPYASDAEKVRPAGAVPTVEEYAAIAEASGRTSTGDGLRAWREEQQAANLERDEAERG